MMEAYIRWKHTNNRLYLVLLPIILWIGANVVGGFLFIPAIVLVCMGAVDLGTVIVTSQTINHRLQLLRTWFFVLVGSMAATLFTPSGMRLPIYSTTMVALLLSKKWYSTLGGALEAANSSIIKSAPSGIVFIIPLLFIIWLLAVLSYMTLSHTSSFTKRNIILIPLVPLLFFPFLWVRFIPLAILCSLPLVMLSIDSIRGNLRQFFLPILMGISTLLALGMWFRPPTLLS